MLAHFQTFVRGGSGRAVFQVSRCRGQKIQKGMGKIDCFGSEGWTVLQGLSTRLLYIHILVCFVKEPHRLDAASDEYGVFRSSG
eukprot:4942387-Amphidinium_carterae.1